MGDPLSIIAGVVGIATAAVQSSKTLIDLMKTIRGAPAEVTAISRDVYAFASIVLTVSATVEQDVLRGFLSDDGSIVSIIGNLRLPLSNCQAVLEELIAKLQKGSRLSLMNNGSRSAFMNITWVMFTKNEVKELRGRLENAKSTLDVALSAISYVIFSFCGRDADDNKTLQCAPAG